MKLVEQTKRFLQVTVPLYDAHTAIDCATFLGLVHTRTVANGYWTQVKGGKVRVYFLKDHEVEGFIRNESISVKLAGESKPVKLQPGEKPLTATLTLRFIPEGE